MHEEKANAIILLTCCVRASAEQRLYGRLSSLKSLKDGRPITIAVGGCLAQKEGGRILQELPHVDLVFGTHQYPEIAGLLARAEKAALCQTGFTGLKMTSTPFYHSEHFRAWITITHGCENYCSYCIVPFVRGKEVSRPLEEVMEEVASHVHGGAREINLLGQNVNSYRLREDGESAFPGLLRRLGDQFPGLWVRFTTSHPRDFDSAIMRAIADTANVCEHVHLPLQAGSDRILESMNRGYTAAEYMQKAERLRRTIVDVSLATDLIVGYPGETEADFQKTMEVVEACRFDAAFTFIYNPREGTAAARMADDVPAETKRDRLQGLMSLTRRLTAESLRREVGKEITVMVNGPSRKDQGRWAARTRNNKIVHFERREDELAGKLARVTITGAGNWSLQAKMLEVIG